MVLPTILILIAVATSTGYGRVDWVEFILKLIVVGPVVGFAIGGVGSWLIFQLDRQTPIRRERQSLYGIGLVLGSYAAGTAVGGDGFLAAFAAGLAVVLLNQTLCDCFLEYGEVTSEMTMLLSFVLFGVVLSEILQDAPIWPSIALAAVLIFAVRPASLGAVLSRAHASWEARLFIAWFGPRGLNSLLLALLAVHAGVPGAEELLAVVGIVVLASTILHGASATPASAWYARRISGKVHEEERESDAAAIFGTHEEVIPRISVKELSERLQSHPAPLILDVRSRMSYEHDEGRIPGDIRVPPDRIAEWARTVPKGQSVVVYCT